MIYERGGHPGHVTQMPRTNFRFPFPRRLNIKFGFDWPSGFRGEMMFENGNGWTSDDRRRTMDGRRTIGIL